MEGIMDCVPGNNNMEIKSDENIKANRNFKTSIKPLENTFLELHGKM